MKGLYRKREEGFSLAELIIAMAVTLIGFAASYNLFQLGYKYLNLGTDVTQARQEIRMAVENIVKELQETAGSTVWVGDEAISFASARDANNNFSTITEPPENRGKPNWQKAVVYFRDAGWNYHKDAPWNALVRYEEAKTDWEANFNPEIAFDRYEEAKADWEANPNFDENYPFNPNEPDLRLMAKSATSMVFLLSGNFITIQGESTSGGLTTTIKIQN
jgi:prepilin-type N-terminal cleavage/methylation domain-containing protein